MLEEYGISELQDRFIETRMIFRQLFADASHVRSASAAPVLVTAPAPVRRWRQPPR